MKMENLKELTENEMRNTDGGIVGLLIVGACLLLAGCATTREVGNITHDPNASDSTQNN